MKKKIFCIFLALVMTLTSLVVFGEDLHCKYWYEGGPDCEIAIDSDENEHWYICIYHVEDKEDMYSHVVLDGTNAEHTYSDGKCTFCRRKDPNATETPVTPDDYPDSVYDELLFVEGALAYELSKDGSSLNVHITEMYEMLCLEYGIPVENTEEFSFEAAYAGDTLTLVLDKSAYAYTGEPVYPNIDLKKELSGYLGFMYELNGDATFENNVEPGTATVSLPIIDIATGNEYVLKKDFIITTETINNTELATGDLDGNDTIDASDALFSLKAVAKLSDLTETQMVAADVNKDGHITADDALLILKYAAKLIDSF